MVETKASKATAPAKIDITNFSELVAGLSRAFAGLAAMSAFRDSKLGLADWVALSVLSSGAGVSNSQLARALGVTRQRANQICTSLSEAGFISAVKSTEDNRVKIIKITEAGLAQYAAVNSQLEPLLEKASRGRARSLIAARRVVKILMRFVKLGNVEKRKKKSASKAAGAAQ